MRIRRSYELLQLRRPPNRLSRREYDLFDLAKLDWDRKTQFLGARAVVAMSSVNDRRSVVLTRDKLTTYTLLRAHGIPFPDVKAVAHPNRRYPGAPSLPSTDAVGEFLASKARFPLFVKPNAGNGGFGSAIVEGFGENSLRLRDGNLIKLDHYFDQWLVKDGLIFQELAHPHPDLAAAIGPRLATARIVVLAFDSGAVVHRASLRIPTGANMIDNFRHGASGNLLAAIDIDSGRLYNVVGKRRGQLETVLEHPDTGCNLVGRQVTDWHAAKKLCEEAAALFPGIRLQSWDVAFTDNGPQVIETNQAGDFDVLQLPARQGIADENWWKLCREPKASFLRHLLVRNGPWKTR